MLAHMLYNEEEMLTVFRNNVYSVKSFSLIAKMQSRLMGRPLVLQDKLKCGLMMKSRFCLTVEEIFHSEPNWWAV